MGTTGVSTSPRRKNKKTQNGRLIYSIHPTRILNLAGICNQVIRHRFVKVVLGKARVELHDPLELFVLSN